MVKNYNTSIAQDAQRHFNFKGENFSTEMPSYITPVYQITKKADLIKLNQLTNATSSTIFTSASDKDTYISALALSYAKDAANTATYCRIAGTVEGVSVIMHQIALLPSTAGTGGFSITLPYPIKVDRGTAVQVLADNGTAVIRVSAIVNGYTVETTSSVN